MGCLRCMSRVKSFHVKILLLDKQELIQEVTETTTGQDLLDNIFKYLNLIETAYFGLRYQDNENQTHWLDPKKKVCRQIRGVAPITLYLGVKFYAADPCRLVEEITRYQFFLQVKQDVLQGRLPVTQDLAVELAALALQSELGDYDPKQHCSPGYVSDFRFISAQTEEFEGDVEAAHASMTGMGIVPATAEMTYLEKVKWLDMYGVDLHPVIGEDNIEYFLGLTPSGIIVLRNRTKVGNYFWPRITKIYFKGKYFMLRIRDKNNDDSTYGFETPSRQACKHLWKCCVEHHAFFRLVQVSPSFVGTGVFSLGSRFRYSGHTEKQVMQQVQSVRRQQPQFTRRPSRRLSNRSSHGYNQDKSLAPDVVRSSPVVLSSLANGSLKRQSSNGNGTNGSPGKPIPATASYNRNRTNSLPRHVSMMASNMRQHQHNNPEESLQDLSLQSLQWLESRGLYENSRQERNSRRASLPEQIQANGYYRRRGGGSHNHHQGASGGGGQSDAESEASGVSWASGLHNRKRNESGSESERSVRRTHRSRRKRQGSYKLIESDEQYTHHQRRSESEQIHSSRKSGYMNSGAETETETNSHASMKRNRRHRQRSRSRSPGDSRARLPPEVLQHLQFGLVEPNDDVTLRGDIPFTNVETTSNHYYSRSQRQLKTATTRSVVSAMETSAINHDKLGHQRHHVETASSISHMPSATKRPVPPPPPAVVSYQQNVSRSSPSSANSQFVWPPKYVTTSTPVTNSSASTSPLRNFHNVVGLPVTSTQYKSPYAVPNAQSSSGSSQANGDNNNGYNFHHALPPTVLIQQMQHPQRSPRNENTGRTPPPLPLNGPMYSKYLQQNRLIRNGNGFAAAVVVPSGDEMSTEL